MIGTSLNGVVGEVRIPCEAFLRHAVIVGSTGSGKTNTACNIAVELSRCPKSRVVVVDWHGEYSDVLEGVTSINIVVPSRDTPVPLPCSSVSEVLGILEEVLSLTPPQVYILQKVIENTGCDISLNELYDIIESTPVEARWMVESKFSLLRKLSLIALDEHVGMFSFRNNVMLSLLREGYVNIVDLSGIHSIDIKRLATISLVRVLEHIKRSASSTHGHHDNTFVIVEEAHNMMTDAGRQFFERLFSEVRKLRMGILLITQSPLVLGHRIITNANIRIVHSLKAKDDIELMGRSMVLSKELINSIPRLDVGTAIVDSPTFSNPKLVRIPYVKELIN